MVQVNLATSSYVGITQALKVEVAALNKTLTEFKMEQAASVPSQTLEETEDTQDTQQSRQSRSWRSASDGKGLKLEAETFGRNRMGGEIWSATNRTLFTMFDFRL